MSFDLRASAREEMIREGFDPDFSPSVEEQIKTIRTRSFTMAGNGVRDLRDRLWSSIDNQTSHDLDQVEFAERVDGGIRVLIGIADVDSEVPIRSPIDQHAASQTTTVYTPARIFPMLPLALSNGTTSLSPDSDRLAVVVEMLVANDGSILSSDVYRAAVRNRFQLVYDAIGPWLEGKAAPPPNVAAATELQAQLKLQDEAASNLREQRHRLGALDFDRIEAQPIMDDGEVRGIAARHANRATNLIEDFMIAANEVMAQRLTHAGLSIVRRVVKTPRRWPRIVQLAASYGMNLPAEPDSSALAAFLNRQKLIDELHYADLSLALVKLMGPGEYVLSRAGDPPQGHFALAAHDYTHSTAPNRRFADLVTQRLIKAELTKQPAPYFDGELDQIARNCTLKEDAARKVERTMGKRAAALAFRNRKGQSFNAVITGVSAKGVFVRVLNPPIEGRLMHGEREVDVGDKIRVTLLNTDPQRGYIDFER